MDRRLNARLDDALAEKLERLKRVTGKGTTAIVREALETYYAAVTSREGDAEDVLRANGFLGCAEADPDLSSNYKAALTESLNKKV